MVPYVISLSLRLLSSLFLYLVYFLPRCIYVIPDVLLASWWLPLQSTTPREKGQPRTRVIPRRHKDPRLGESEALNDRGQLEGPPHGRAGEDGAKIQ